MAVFDLGKFRDLAFGREALPDHPMSTVAEAQKLLALLPGDDPDTALADLTHWAATMNATESFTPGRRAQVLMELDTAARPLWRAQSERYLRPGGRLSEGRDGDPGLLRALNDCAAEIANGYAIALDATDEESAWMTKNRPLVVQRNLRWLNRRLAIAHMLQLSAVAAVWERLHRLHAIAEEGKYARTALPVPGNEAKTSSARSEYAHALLLELAAPDSLRGREVELAFRIAQRVATTVQIEAAATPDATFAVVPMGDERPQQVRRLGGGALPGLLYINTANALPRLRAALERDLGRDPAETDTLFGSEYTLRERNALLNRLLEHWGPNPPQRRLKRVAMATPVRLMAGFDAVVGVVPALEKKRVPDADRSRRELQLMLDASTGSLRNATVKASRQSPARLVDASAGGMGVAVRRADARWAKLGELVATLIEPGPDWVLCVVRRVFAVDDELRLGLQLLAAKPRLVILRANPGVAGGSAEVWSEAMVHEESFREHFKNAILLAPQPTPLAAADFVLAPKTATRGTQFDLQLARGTQRLRITRLHVDSEHFQRAAFEPLVK
jgi:hypothetical protein